MLERGIITQISGPVVDVEIVDGELPRLREELTVEKNGEERVMEVAQHVGRGTVRCIMLSPSEGLARGLAVDVPGHTIQVPVGEATLGRMFNVLGQPIDGAGPVPEGTPEDVTVLRQPIQNIYLQATAAMDCFRKLDALDAVTQEMAWWCILIGAAIAICGSAVAGMPAGLGTAGLVILVLGVVLLPVGSIIRSKSALGAITWLWDAYQGISGYFSDILSYSRLMALMLAGAVIAQVFNTLGAMTGLIPTFILISLVGNALNFALNILGCFVHDMRLQCLEFFGRFYEDGGKPFRPLNINTKYVDIEKE